MILGLIGMSGAGKSSWAARLAAAGYTWLHCDELIAARLRVSHQVAAESVSDLGRWMGFPYDARYARHEALYLAYETEVLREIAAALAQSGDPGARLIVDMTGSAIYVDAEVLRSIRRAATIVYLAISPDRQQQMVQDYLASPRPIVWHGLFRPRPQEEPAAALARCYPDLLAARASEYAELSDITFEDSLHRDPELTVEGFLRHCTTDKVAR
ncbi:MAG: hypothetical protein IPO81_22855 [Kouleothrix sp.]|nr:hypothetical protein [Kouleothrix sp.]